MRVRISVSVMNAVDVRVSRASKPQDYDACVQLQREVWGSTGSNNLVGSPLLVIANRYGGSLLTAQDPGGQVVGFSLAVLCQEPDGAPFWWSHGTLVLPDWQHKDIGVALKLAQRRDALDRGIKEVRWAFDPFHLVTAHFSIRKLGSVIRHMAEDLCGTRADLLNAGLMSDCLLAEWHLESARVTDRISGNAGLILRDLDGLLRIVEAVNQRPEAPNLTLEETVLLMEVPRDFEAIAQKDRPLALEWQQTVRAACRHYLGRGYAITDFMLVERPRAQALYVLERLVP